MFHFRTLTLFCASVLASVGVMQGDSCCGQTQLQWKFEKGKSLFYRFSRSQDATVTLPNGQTDKNLRNAIYDLEVVCKKLRVNGTAEVEVFIRRLIVEMEQANGAISYDSSSEAGAVSATEVLLFPVFELVTKHSFTANITPNAKVTRVKVPKELREAIQDNPLTQVFAEQFASAKSKKAILEKIFVMLPRKTIKSGEKLSQSESEVSPGGITTTTVEYEYQGLKNHNAGKMHGFDVKFSIQSDDPKIQISGESSDGAMLFDQVQGRLESFEANHKHTLVAKRNEDDPGLNVESENRFQVERMTGFDKK